MRIIIIDYTYISNSLYVSAQARMQPGLSDYLAPVHASVAAVLRLYECVAAEPPFPDSVYAARTLRCAAVRPVLLTEVVLDRKLSVG